jgi:hypothetical protein
VEGGLKGGEAILNRTAEDEKGGSCKPPTPKYDKENGDVWGKGVGKHTHNRQVTISLKSASQLVFVMGKETQSLVTLHPSFQLFRTGTIGYTLFGSLSTLSVLILIAAN